MPGATETWMTGPLVGAVEVPFAAAPPPIAMSALSPVNEFTQFLVSVTVANGMFTNGLVIEGFGAAA